MFTTLVETGLYSEVSPPNHAQVLSKEIVGIRHHIRYAKSEAAQRIPRITFALLTSSKVLCKSFLIHQPFFRTAGSYKLQKSPVVFGDVGQINLSFIVHLQDRIPGGGENAECGLYLRPTAVAGRDFIVRIAVAVCVFLPLNAFSTL